MKARRACLVTLILLVWMMALTGCTGISQPSKFFLLRPLPESENRMLSAAGKGGLSVLIGPISLPVYLDRTQLATRAGSHQLNLDEFNRWAEPLPDNFYRVLKENLSLLLNTPQVYTFNRGSTPADLQIVIDVTRFDGLADGRAYLAAFWTVVAEDGRTVLLNKKSVFHATALPTAAGVVEAQNQTLTEFSREISTAIQTLRPQTP